MRHAAEIHLFGKYLTRAYYVGDNELRARWAMTLSLQIWSSGKEGGYLTSDLKKGVMIVAVESVTEYSAGKLKRLVFSLSLSHYSSLNYLH